jgi:hypothetical protein
VYLQHGFWGEFTHHYCFHLLTHYLRGWVVRQSLSSHTADIIQNFQTSFGDLAQTFKSAVSIQALTTTVEIWDDFRIVKRDLKSMGDVIVTQAEKGLFVIRVECHRIRLHKSL